MWLSETRKRIGADSVTASVCAADDTSTEALRPANILRMPKNGEAQLILNCTDGSSILLGVVGGDTPEDLLPGEVCIKTDNACVTIKNSGAVNISGTVNITGSLTVNGASVTA